MSAKKYNSDRKRSRPVTKRRKTDLFKKNRLVTAFVLIIIVVVVIAGVYVVYTGYIENDNNESGDQNNGSNGKGTEEGNPIAVIDTSMGTIKVELFKDNVTNTCENFIKLANAGFYDGLVFHRVIDDFMIQGGGFKSDGSQKESPYGTIDLEIHPDIRHVDGAIAMARTNDPNSATSQFYICDSAQPNLDDNYAAFGVTIEGINVVRSIASVQTTMKNGMNDWPAEDVLINSIKIEND